MYEKYKVDVPEGQNGNWEISRFEVDRNSEMIHNIRESFRLGRIIEQGTYTQLKHFDEVVMSDTPAEIKDFLPFLHKAYGQVLLNGLGLGCLLQALLNKPEIKSVMVLEKSIEVIRLVEPHYRNKFPDKNFTILNEDALEYTFNRFINFDCVYHDIWNTICEDNYEEMKKLHRKYGKKCKFQMSWSRSIVERLKKKRRNDGMGLYF